MYAQQNYNQKLGNGQLTISEAGCLLTAFSNLLERFGEGKDPVSLNDYFMEQGSYIRDSDGAYEDLAWGSVAAYDGNIVVRSVGSSDIPDSNNAIVKFHYNSVHSGQPIDHFCLVDHIENGQVFIVDSWDGRVKGPGAYQGVYHSHIAWASYVKNTPAPPPLPPQYALQPFSPHEMILTGDVSMWDLSTPQADIAVGNYSNGYRFMAQGKALHNDGRVYYLPDVTIPHGFLDENCVDYVLLPPAPPSAPVPIPTSTDPYTIVKTILAFSTSNDAVNYINAKGTVAPGNYYIFNRRTVAETGQEVLNVTKVVGQAGSWINPIDNIREPEPIPEPPTPVVVPEVPKPTPLPIDPPHSTNWKATYKSFNPQRIPLVYKALTNLVVSDISGSRGGVIRVPKGQHINVYGTFTRNNTKYGRLKIKADIEFKYFYGVRLVDIQKMATFNLTPLTRAMDYLSLNKAKVETFEDDAIKFLDMPFKIFKKNKR